MPSPSHLVGGEGEVILLVAEEAGHVVVLDGVYGGGVGYFSAGGDMDMCIALRTAVLKDEKLYIQAGGGVVYDSDPEAEYQETVNKAKAVWTAAVDAANFAGRGNG